MFVALYLLGGRGVPSEVFVELLLAVEVREPSEVFVALSSAAGGALSVRRHSVVRRTPVWDSQKLGLDPVPTPVPSHLIICVLP